MQRLRKLCVGFFALTLLACDRGDKHPVGHDHSARQSHVESEDHHHHEHHSPSELEIEQEQGERQQNAHVHGEVELNLVLEGQQLKLVAQLPAMDLVGFERMPYNDEEREQLAQLREKLQEPAHLFELPAAAECELVSINMESPLLGDGSQTIDGTHLDFLVAYDFICQQPQALDDLQVKVFSHFVTVQRVHLSWIRNQYQGAMQLSAEQSLARLQ